MTNYEETYLDRIKALKSQKKITNNMLSDMTGIPLGTLSKLLAGISDSPKLSNIVSIANALGCSLDWLISGVPENNNNYMLEDGEIEFIESYRTLDEYGKKMVRTVASLESERVQGAKAETAAAPVAKILSSPRRLIQHNASVPTKGFVPSSIIRSNTTEELPAGLRKRPITLFDMPVSAGSGVMLTESAASEIIIPDMPRTKEADYALRIYGDSMEPRYHSGDIVLVQTVDYVPEGELGIFILDGNGYFKKYDGDRLLSLNTKYPPILLKDFTDISCAGRVIGKLKKK
ncbi:MAG: helix-turn-helix domain-containing protein [Clostridia bacterium]|nr:helix-turn-helix domain-containing protein [Clostridia bacterium]